MRSSQSRPGGMFVTRRIRPLPIVIAVGTIVLILYYVFQMSRGSTASAQPIALLPTEDFHALAFGSAPDTVFFGHHNGLLISHDLGVTWVKTTLTGADAMNVTTLLSQPQRVYVSGHGIFYRSDDGGLTWSTPAVTIQGTDIHGFTASSDDANRLYAFVAGQGIQTSTDGGLTWQLLPTDLGQVTALAAGRGATLYVGTSAEGVFESSDGGLHWARTGLNNAQITSLTVDQQTGDIYAAALMGARSMLHRRVAGSTAWDLLPLDVGPIIAMTTGSVGGQTLLVINQRGQLFRSRDSGQTWGNG